jgi:hypothetical protein
VLAPHGAARWQFGDQELLAPPHRVFDQGVSADFNEDGRADAVAWILPTADSGPAPPGELWFYPNGAERTRLVAAPGYVPSGPDCTLSTELTITGAHTVSVYVRSACKSPLLARSPARAVLVVSPAAKQPLLLGLRAAVPAPNESLELSVDSTDRDGDGRDDVAVNISLQSAPSPTPQARPVSVPLVWLDRVSGLARDTSEPVRTFTELASAEAARARGKAASPVVTVNVSNLRRLYFSLCSESGTPRIFDHEGAAFRCGALGKALEQLAFAELRAWLKQGRLADAFSVLTRDGWYFAPLSEQRRTELIKEATRGMKQLDVSRASTLEARPPRRAGPRFSPLDFESQGTLLVQNADGLTRVSADASREERISADAGSPSWPLEVVSARGLRWSGVSYACDRSELLLTYVDSRSAPGEPQPTDLLAPRPGACRGGSVPQTPDPAPLGWSDGALTAIVAGATVGPPFIAKARLAPHTPGTPFSPDGRWFVAVTPLGLLLDGAKPELWRAPSNGGPLGALRTLSDCVVANEARAAACIQAGRVLFIPRPEPPL